MNVLLLSMPDSFEHMPPVAIRMPNGALASLAGNVDPHHRVAIADLILVQASVRPTIERLVRDLAPDVVGLSVMTFQRTTALGIARLIRSLRPSARIVAGRYDPSLAPDYDSLNAQLAQWDTQHPAAHVVSETPIYDSTRVHTIGYEIRYTG